MRSRRSMIFVLWLAALFPVFENSHAAALSGTYGIGRLGGRGSITFLNSNSCSAVLTNFGNVRENTGVIKGYINTASRNCSYNLKNTGDLTLTFAGETTAYHGTVSADNSSINLDGAGSILHGSKTGSGMSTAALNGYFGIALTVVDEYYARIPAVGSIFFDGIGNCQASLKFSWLQPNRSGRFGIGEEVQNLSCTYSVSSSGYLVLPLNGFSYEGSVSSDGSSFTLAGFGDGFEQAIHTSLMVGNKLGNDLSAASLKGRYGIVAIPGRRGAITFDGNGSCNASFIGSGATNSLCSYSVNSAGCLTLDLDGIYTSYEGHVSSNGSSFTIAGYESSSPGECCKLLMQTGEKIGAAYASVDIAGRWMSGGIRIPARGSDSPENFAKEVRRRLLYVDGWGSSLPLSTSDPDPWIDGEIRFPAGTVFFDEAMPGKVTGVIGPVGQNTFSYMSAGKDVMVHLVQDHSVQLLSVDLKQGSSYSGADFAGTWLSAGIKTPVWLHTDSNNLGYLVERMVLFADGSGNNMTISSSHSPAGNYEVFPAGFFTVGANGIIYSDKAADIYMNASKDVMFQLSRNPTEGSQQFLVSVKQDTGYTMHDLAGTWVGSGIMTPLSGNSPATFGSEVAKLVIESNGSGLRTPILTSSDAASPIAYPNNNFRITSNGTITTFDSKEYFFMNAGKNVLVQLKRDGDGGQQLSVYLKEAAPVTLPDPKNGACGAADGGSFHSAPSANLCSSGTASAVVGDGPWSWSCNGASGGGSASCTAVVDAAPLPVTLTVTLSGTGGGTVQSTPVGISCSNGSASGCSASFTPGQQVQLFVFRSAGSLFTSWGGSINGGTNSLPLVMDDDKAITATFDAMPKVTVASRGFDTLQAGYDDGGTVNGSVIRLFTTLLPGGFTAWKEIGVKIEGGYEFSSRISATNIQSPFLVKSGQVRVQGVRVTP